MDRTEYKVYGLRRSGHHAVLMWLIGMIPKTTLYYNCYLADQKLDRPITANRIQWFQDGREKDISEFHPKKREPNTVFWNAEDSFIDPDFNISEYTFTDSKLLIVLRDPYNLIASRMSFHSKNYEDRIHEIYKHLLIYPETTNVYKINYNYWFSDEVYRKQIAEKLGLNFDDHYLQRLSLSGSSFDKNRNTYENNSQKLKVLERYKNYTEKNNTAYKDYFEKYPELVAIGKEFFNMERPW